ncbi:hypothetical protein [Aestuariicoccus sp. MJ-SS9]|uniref:hypothetical protein n=1 Tax=Aestuariicoccus sp. MJ-SS9 TaxID=3079855 RepID=UPI00290BFDC9|nr:hypothetical protein [Aestuariicoccus sp. MJ-SS9]MDU8910228.1 hypothetical protein [Aestuariicoccus sp. MJ-SS9]
MRVLFAFLLMTQQALACDAPVCEVPQDSLRFTRDITFDALPSGLGVGRELDGIVDESGARFGRYFSGQVLETVGTFDRANGTPTQPLALMAGGKGHNLGAMRLYGTNILHGHGPRGFPNPDAVGEGTIAVLFDRDQPALAFDIVGGERGSAVVTFLNRAGGVLHRLALSELSEATYTFERRGRIPDIAGLLIENDDPEGIGIDNLRFEFDELMGALPQPRGAG